MPCDRWAWGDPAVRTMLARWMAKERHIQGQRKKRKDKGKENRGR